ncbi:hypothetical protein EIN_131350 [Entamoeba invadens IP1]|uniref:Uncharacterized protein n=1 Tax=Entamoeba invadens IP1 TaxID=370355 RepID=A0A0A1UD24_ENTIV|nr:hypothetical protein EIN_131350 [Entamoeba invadens IP1]ELP94326.1 hypothetical protein EIN_131350 [Entamoeba invadens IP1]|eukprot:XP_004261097.1 hypothetical protein EIN_131350 [Entamoeba invadens IP1]
MDKSTGILGVDIGYDTTTISEWINYSPYIHTPNISKRFETRLLWKDGPVFQSLNYENSYALYYKQFFLGIKYSMGAPDDTIPVNRFGAKKVVDGKFELVDGLVVSPEVLFGKMVESFLLSSKKKIETYNIVVVSVPYTFSTSQRNAIDIAFKLLHFKRVEIVTEDFSLLASYMFTVYCPNFERVKNTKESTFILDIGASHTAVYYFSCIGRTGTIVSKRSITSGGLDLDDKLKACIMTKIQVQSQTDELIQEALETSQEDIIHKIEVILPSLKKTFTNSSSMFTTTLALSLDSECDITVTNEEFSALLKDTLENSYNIFEEVESEAQSRMGKEHMMAKTICFIGSLTRLVHVLDFYKSKGYDLNNMMDREKAIAEGACVLAKRFFITQETVERYGEVHDSNNLDFHNIKLLNFNCFVEKGTFQINGEDFPAKAIKCDGMPLMYKGDAYDTKLEIYLKKEKLFDGKRGYVGACLHVQKLLGLSQFNSEEYKQLSDEENSCVEEAIIDNNGVKMQFGKEQMNVCDTQKIANEKLKEWDEITLKFNNIQTTNDLKLNIRVKTQKLKIQQRNEFNKKLKALQTDDVENANRLLEEVTQYVDAIQK